MTPPSQQEFRIGGAYQDISNNMGLVMDPGAATLTIVGTNGQRTAVGGGSPSTPGVETIYGIKVTPTTPNLMTGVKFADLVAGDIIAAKCYAQIPIAWGGTNPTLFVHTVQNPANASTGPVLNASLNFADSAATLPNMLQLNAFVVDYYAAVACSLWAIVRQSDGVSNANPSGASATATAFIRVIKGGF